MNLNNRIKKLEAVAAVRRSRMKREPDMTPQQAHAELKLLLDQLIASETQRLNELKAIMAPEEFKAYEAEQKAASDRERARVMAIEVDERYLSPNADLSGFDEKMQHDITMKMMYSTISWDEYLKAELQPTEAGAPFA